ncbi:hypothetical protein ABZ897_41090 [Nonomuraea sp. NPDC046802]|uniref:hypothetical protein n=1 Tax=Nonomuraea sp. NPDC046802 TaxID=3154919 RepID=UPI0033F9DBA8
MRTMLPAALLLLLSWFLPATAPAQAAAQVMAAPAALLRVQEHPGLRQEPPRHTAAQARHGLPALAGSAGPAVLPSVLPLARPGWSVVVTNRPHGVPGDRRPVAAPARAPPSTGY